MLLYFGANYLVRGAEQIGKYLGLAPVVIGITLVAFGTSAPELAITLDAALTGNPDIALANILGSNIANIGLVIAIVTFISAIQINRSAVIKDVSVMVISFIVLGICLLDYHLTRLEGLFLFSGLLIYLYYHLIHKESIEPESIPDMEDSEMGYLKCGILTLIGVLMLAFGGDILVTGASRLAIDVGVPQSVIAFSVVAIGSSLPEVAASVFAALRGKGGIALGNVVGSNIWNILGVLGLSALITPIVGEDIKPLMLTGMLVYGVLLWLLIRFVSSLKLLHGLFLLSGYFVLQIYIL